MDMAKKIIALAVTVFMLLGAVGCGGDSSGTSSDGGNNVINNEETISTAKFLSGKPKAPGDVFEFTKLVAEDSAPVLASATRQVKANDGITITGEGLSKPNLKAYIYAQTSAGDGKTHEAKFTVVDDHQIVVYCGEDLKYGVYSVYVEADGKKSNSVLVNDPKIWWIAFPEVTYGDKVRIYGENLATENKDKSFVYLTDGDTYCEAEVTYADPYKVEIIIPYGLEDGKEYGILLHNGHGGDQCFAEAEQKLIYVDKKTSDYSEGNVIDVTEHGAVPDDEEDDSIAVQNAVNAAKEGDIIHFPEGTYIMNSDVKVVTPLHFKGEGAEKTKLVMGENVVNGMFEMSVGPCEYSDIYFEYVLGGGKLIAPFIKYRGDTVVTPYYNLYVHNCKFVQATSATSRSQLPAISMEHASGAWIVHNDFMVTELLFPSDAKNIVVEENTGYGTNYVGPYYNQNFFLIWNTENFDASNNYMASADVLTDVTAILEPGDLTLGRAFALQGHNYNFYIANNEIETAGLPNDNAGEQIMLENVEVKYEGVMAEYGSDTVTLPEDITVQYQKGDTIVVIDGKGLGQTRDVVSAKGKTATLDRPWDIIPDENSDIIIQRAFKNFVIHNNQISGYKNYKESYSATTGVQAYGGIVNMYITSNTFKDMYTGMCITTHYRYYDDPKATNGIFWMIIADNIIQNTGIGIRTNLDMIPDTHNRPEPPTLLFGLNIRKNKISYSMDYDAANIVGTGGIGITLGSREGSYVGSVGKTWLGEWTWGTVIENNEFKNSEKANIMLLKHQVKTVLRNNTVTGGDITDIYTLSSNAEKPIIVE